MTLNLIVPFGEVTFVIYDNRDESSTFGNHIIVTLSASNYQRLTVPPALWLHCAARKEKTSFILNIANMEHDPEEIHRLDLSQIDLIGIIYEKVLVTGAYGYLGARLEQLLAGKEF